MRRAALSCLILAAGPVLAAAPAPDEKLKQVERRIEETKKTGADLDRQAQDAAAEVAAREESGLPRNAVITAVARERGLPRRDVYDAVVRARSHHPL